MAEGQHRASLGFWNSGREESDSKVFNKLQATSWTSRPNRPKFNCKPLSDQVEIQGGQTPNELGTYRIEVADQGAHWLAPPEVRLHSTGKTKTLKRKTSSSKNKLNHSSNSPSNRSKINQMISEHKRVSATSNVGLEHPNPTNAQTISSKNKRRFTTNEFTC